MDMTSDQPTPPAFPYVVAEYPAEDFDVVEFLWPSDRIIMFQNPEYPPPPPSEEEEQRRQGLSGMAWGIGDADEARHYMVPTFDLRLVGGTVATHAAQAVRSARLAQPMTCEDRLVAHVVRVHGYPNRLGVAVHRSRCLPPSDVFAGEQAEDDEELNARRAASQ